MTTVTTHFSWKSSWNCSKGTSTCKIHPLLIDNSFHPQKHFWFPLQKHTSPNWLLLVFTCKATAVAQWWHVTVSLVDAHRHIQRYSENNSLLFSFKITAKKYFDMLIIAANSYRFKHICWLFLYFRQKDQLQWCENQKKGHKILLNVVLLVIPK